MIPTLTFAGQRAVVVGLGKSGLSAAAALGAGGADVSVWDDAPAARLGAAQRNLKILDVEKDQLDRVACVVWSPGVPHELPNPHPLAQRARARGIPVVCDIDVLARAEPAASYIGITGTNGKSTTTALTAHVLAASGRRVAVGGNLGTPALDLAPLGPFGTYVLELSSYQLELTSTLSCDVAILLNITPDHLDRHGGMDGYIAAKMNIFERPRFPAIAVVGVDDVHGQAIAERLRSAGRHRVIDISTERVVPGGVYINNGSLIDAIDGRARVVAEVAAWPCLPGRHNWQNAAAATAVARVLGVPGPAVATALASFAGLAHRQELVATIRGVRFINDSKATNADATEKALACYDNVFWIAGGRAKDGGIESAPYFPRIRRGYLIGEAADQFADTLEGKVPFDLYDDFETAIEEAGSAALKSKLPGAVVLLSPACASFDMFKSFEDRGDRFRREVHAVWPTNAPASGELGVSL